jgi:CHAT domain-containing protein
MQDVSHTKERILKIIQERGPSFPVQIARTINVSPLFTSVFLSELYEDSKLRMSHMKIGSSSLYFVQGQEAMLENFIEHLNQREKEVFTLIKRELVLEDEKQTPITRVALRAIKDFALPFKITINSTDKIFWKYHLLSDSDFDRKIKRILDPLAPIEEKKEEKEIILPKVEIKLKEEKAPDEPVIDANSNIQDELQKPEPSKSKKKIVSKFADNIKDYLASKDIEILTSILEKKKEFMAKIRTDTLFGKQEYYLIAKDKKKINETDITLALQKAQSEKMPALILSPGEIDKKAHPHIKEWRNLVKFEKIKF